MNAREIVHPLDDPRVVAQSYVVRPTGYDEFVNSDKDMWCLTVTDGHRWGWSIRRGIGADGPAMNRKGEWVFESRGHGNNKHRRWSLDEALRIALAHVDINILNGFTAAGASATIAARIASREQG